MSKPRENRGGDPIGRTRGRWKKRAETRINGNVQDT